MYSVARCQLHLARKGKPALWNTLHWFQKKPWCFEHNSFYSCCPCTLIYTEDRYSPWSSPAASSRGPGRLSFGRCLREVGCSASVTLPRAARKIKCHFARICDIHSCFSREELDSGRGTITLNCWLRKFQFALQKEQTIPVTSHKKTKAMHFVSEFRPFFCKPKSRPSHMAAV